MKPFLTTITPVWSRWNVFQTWRQNLEAAHVEGLKHMVFCPGQPKADLPKAGEHFQFLTQGEPGDSIGSFHDQGAYLAESEWVMKLDLDAMVNPSYFWELLKVLKTAKPREWFNGGMLYVNQAYSLAYLDDPVTLQGYNYLMNKRAVVASFAGTLGGSNFICRREDYLGMGGCSSQFKGWGWEDYQQTFGLEARFLGRSPLPGGTLTTANVTGICRDLITRPKAARLLTHSPYLSLLHRHHEPASRRNSQANKQVLLNFIQNYETRHRSPVSREAQEVRIL